MYNFGIIDDDIYFLEILQNKISTLLFPSEINAKIYTYNQVEPFLNDLTKRRYDILFLDIDMPNVDGISLAKLIRNYEHSPIIIFVTSKEEYMKSAFGLNVFSFLIKKELDITLESTINECIRYICENKGLVFKTNIGVHTFYINDIICIYSEDRKIYILTYSDKFQIYQETLESVFDKINSLNFVYASRGSIVNLKYVINTKGGCITFHGTEHKEYISRERIKDLDKQLINYVLKQVIYQ